MDFLNVILGFSITIWVVIGIKTHASWISATFIKELEKIDFQQYKINSDGYDSISFDKNLQPQRVFVYGYWGDQKEESLDKHQITKRSPIIFRIVNASLISFTSISILIILSKGFLASIGIL